MLSLVHMLDFHALGRLPVAVLVLASCKSMPMPWPDCALSMTPCGRPTCTTALGRSRGGFTSKLHCLADALGRPVAFHLTGGEAADCKAYDDLIDLPEQAPDAFLADKGYDADAIRADLAERKIKAVIPGRSNRRVKIEYDRALYKQRNRIERMFGHLKINRAIATRYDQLASSFFGMVHLATARYWLKFVHAA